MSAKISIKDIAKITGTSITTVSFVINGKAKEKNISVAMTKKIQKVVAELGYKPNALARGLRTGKSKIIGFLVDDISKPFFSNIATSIDQRASKHGYKLIFSSIGRNKLRANEILQIFKERQVDGYVIAISAGVEEEIIELLNNEIPVVFFDRYLPEIKGDYVLTDNQFSTHQATQHLIDNGFKNIGFVTIQTEELQMLDRLKGYNDTLEQAGLKAQVLAIDYSDSTKATRYIKNFLIDHPGLDAIVFASNYLTMHGLQILKTDDRELLSLKGMVSFDDFELLEFLNPAITAVEQPAEEIAEALINMLIKKMTQKIAPAKTTYEIINLKAKLNIRQSSKR